MTTLTATQLRNARKRRSLQRKRQQQQEEGHNNSPRKRPRLSNHATAGVHEVLDPSMQYIQDPLQAPLVKQAKSFFSDKLPPPSTTTTESSKSSESGSADPAPTNPRFQVFLGPCYEWRTLVKLAVRQSTESQNQPEPLLTLGLFAPHTHSLVPNSGSTCRLHHPVVNHALMRVEAWARQLNVTAFSEHDNDNSNKDPQLKYVTASLERATQRVQLTLIWQQPSKDRPPKQSRDSNNNDPTQSCSDSTNENVCQHPVVHKLCQALIQDGTCPPSNSSKKNKKKKKRAATTNGAWLHSLWLHVHPYNWSRHNNAIYAIPSSNQEGGTWQTIHGPSTGTEESFGLSVLGSPPPTLSFPPTVFRQGNLDAFGAIVGQIRSFLQEQKPLSPNNKKLQLVELYGGVGTIGLHLTDLCASYICSDENPHNQACFERAVQSIRAQGPGNDNDDKKQCDIQYLPLNATDMVQQQKHVFSKADWIIVDPPRKGLEPVVCQALTNHGRASILVYVSCGFSAFVRDYQHLTSSNSRHSWELVHASGHVLFPGSNAIETLAFFRRCRPS